MDEYNHLKLSEFRDNMLTRVDFQLNLEYASLSKKFG